MELDGYTIADAVVAIIVLISAVLAFSRGFVREVMSILGWVIAAVAAFSFAPQVEPMIKEVPILKDIIGGSCELAILAAFAAVFAAALIVVSIFTPLLSGFVSNSALGPMDQGLGFLFGVARGALLIVVALIVYDIAIGAGEGYPEIEDSRSRVLFADLKTSLEAQIPEDAPGWVASQYEKLTGSCAAPAAPGIDG